MGAAKKPNSLSFSSDSGVRLEGETDGDGILWTTSGKLFPPGLEFQLLS